MAALITEAVPPTETGIATGINTVMRTIGAVIGGQVGAASPHLLHDRRDCRADRERLRDDVLLSCAAALVAAGWPSS